MGKLFIVLLLFNLFGCTLNYDEEPDPQYAITAREIRSNSAEKLAEKYDMHVCGYIGGMMNQVNHLGIAFQIFRPLTQDEARELVIKCALEFLDAINCNEQIQSYLVTRPFTSKNIEIEIFTRNEDNTETFDPYIRVVVAKKGKVTFATKSPLKEFGYENFYVETFEKALAKTKFYQS